MSEQYQSLSLSINLPLDCGPVGNPGRDSILVMLSGPL